MKNTRKLLAVLLAAMLIISLSVTAFADMSEITPNANGQYSITLNLPDDTEANAREFSYFQIFKGTPTKDESGKFLSDITWGDDVDPTGLIDDLVAFDSSLFKADMTAYQIAKGMADVSRKGQLAIIIESNLVGTGHIMGDYHLVDGSVVQINGSTPISADGTEHVKYYSEVDPGYYLIKNTGVIHEGASPTNFILEVSGNTAVTAKLQSVPTFDKEVADWNESVLETGKTSAVYSDTDSFAQILGAYNWASSADHKIGDTIPYHLNAQLPTLVGESELGTVHLQNTAYSIRFVDNMSKGLTLDTNADGTVKNLVVFYGSGSNYTKANLVTKAAYTAFMDNAANSAEAKAEYAANNFYYEYAVTADGTELKVACDNIIKMGNYTTYNNNGASVDVSPKNNHVHVFYTCTLNENAKIGTGADKFDGNPNTAFLEYSTHPDGGFGGHTAPDKNEVYTLQLQINKVDENKMPLKGADFTLEKLDAKTNTYVPVETVYETVTGNRPVEPVHPGDDANEDAKEAYKTQYAQYEKDLRNFLKDNTAFKFVGLDDGQYRLTETLNPVGYNKLTAPIVFTISATHSPSGNTPMLESVGVTKISGPEGLEFTTVESTSVVVHPDRISATVVNERGVMLPSTGGIGTTIFYVVGGLMMFGAVVLLVTKKRMADVQ